MSLLLSDEKARKLIEMLKSIVKRHALDINNSFKGDIHLKGFDNRELTINYHISRNIDNRYSINLMDNLTKHTLVRINVTNESTFHKNANGERIYGNRVNIFSAEEYERKGDGYTHYRAYKLPHNNLIVHPSFVDTLDSFLEYTNTLKSDKLIVKSTSIQLELFN